MPPKITVIIPTFNRAIYLAECLDSILGQTVAPHQIILINNRSTDHTQEVCRSYEGRIEYYEYSKLGKSSVVNFGLQKSTGDYIWIFDDDDVAVEDALERFVKPLEDDKNLSFSYGTFFYASNNSANNKIGAVIRESQIPVFEQGFLNALLEANFLGGASLFARASTYMEVGDFDPELLRSQDYDMAIRIARRFKGVRISGQAAFYYRQHEGIRGKNTDFFRPAQNNEKWLKYDQSIFSKVYQNFSLSEFAFPGEVFNQRKAILERMLVMASKALFLEVILDVQQLSLVKDDKPFTKDEYSIVRKMILNRPYHVISSIFEYEPFFKEVCSAARHSPVVNLLRINLLKTFIALCKNSPSFKNISQCIKQTVCLYFGGI